MAIHWRPSPAEAEVFERASAAWISGTYHGWPPAIVAASATLSVLEREPVARHVWTMGERLMAGFNAIAQRNGLAARLAGAPPAPQLASPADESATIERICCQMIARGYFIHPIRPWFVSYAHDAECIEQTLADLEIAVRQVTAC